jgi:thioredoxin-like negative regulator of GroEL
MSFDKFVDGAGEHAPLLRAVARRTQIPRDFSERLRALGGQWHVLVLTEDWCGDSTNALPVIARLAADAGNVDLRILKRDEHPALMDAHLAVTGARAIPVVIVLDAAYEERGWWGSRPRALQRLVDTEWKHLSKVDRYTEVRRWYVSDKGTSIAEELTALLTRVGAMLSVRCL